MNGGQPRSLPSVPLVPTEDAPPCSALLREPSFFVKSLFKAPRLQLFENSRVQEWGYEVKVRRSPGQDGLAKGEKALGPMMWGQSYHSYD